MTNKALNCIKMPDEICVRTRKKDADMIICEHAARVVLGLRDCLFAKWA